MEWCVILYDAYPMRTNIPIQMQVHDIKVEGNVQRLLRTAAPSKMFLNAFIVPVYGEQSALQRFVDGFGGLWLIHVRPSRVPCVLNRLSYLEPVTPHAFLVFLDKFRTIGLCAIRV